MKLIVEYLADAVKFERFAALEQKPEQREQLERQAKAYRELAENRAEQLGLPPLGTVQHLSWQADDKERSKV